MFKDKLKSIIIKKENSESPGTEGINGNNKRKIENLVFLIIILIVTVVIINYIWNGNKNSGKTLTNSAGKQLATTQNSQTQNQSQTKIQNETETTNNLEQRLEYILSNISGVGEVKVFINYSESSETVAMYNENSKTSVTEETDTSGGIRKVEESNSQ